MHNINENSCIHELGLHLVFCTKYRKAIFTGAIEVELKEIIGQTCAEYGWKVQALEIMPEHIHLFIQVGPEDQPVDVARTLKSISAVQIFAKFPNLKGRKFWGSGLWNRGCYYGSVGNVNAETISKYIDNQKL